MNKRAVNGLVVISLIALFFIAWNSSLWAPKPTGRINMIAEGGARYLPTADAPADCPVRKIAEVGLPLFENSISSIRRAADFEADVVEVDVRAAKDGLVLFGDDELDCRTDGKGAVKDKSVAELRQIDIAYGYSPDGGDTFPMRGQGRGLMPTAAAAIAGNPTLPLIFHLSADGTEEAEMLVQAIKETKRDYKEMNDGFYGSAEAVAHIRKALPGAWAFTKEEAVACHGDYAAWGWTGNVPESCQGGTIFVPVDSQWNMWGFPDRMIARFKDANARIIVTGPLAEGDEITGLTQPKQIGKVPMSFRGYLWVEDIVSVGPALIR